MDVRLVRDRHGHLVALIPSDWTLRTFTEKNEKWEISEVPFPPPQGE
jgi:hypothetical protein